MIYDLNGIELASSLLISTFRILYLFNYLGVIFPMVPVVDDKFRCESIELTLFNVGECCPIVGEAGLFFHGWNPLPIAASANGGGDLFDNLLHWAANIANGVPRICDWSWTRENEMRKKSHINFIFQH